MDMMKNNNHQKSMTDRRDLSTPLSSSQKLSNSRILDNDAAKNMSNDDVIEDIYRISQIAELKRKLNELRRTPSKSTHNMSNSNTPSRGDVRSVSKYEFECLTNELKELRRSVDRVRLLRW